MAAKPGYGSRGTRARFDGKFEVQLRPWVFKCDLDWNDWGLPPNAKEFASRLNIELINAVNGTDRAAAESKLAQSVASMPLSLEQKTTVLKVVERLLRAAFE